METSLTSEHVRREGVAPREQRHFAKNIRRELITLQHGMVRGLVLVSVGRYQVDIGQISSEPMVDRVKEVATKIGDDPCAGVAPRGSLDELSSAVPVEEIASVNVSDGPFFQQPLGRRNVRFETMVVCGVNEHVLASGVSLEFVVGGRFS
jgi:hypothetical protein